MPTLLGHLAQFASFSRQGEVLTTQGLTYLLSEYRDARDAFAAKVCARTGVDLPADLGWLAERRQVDGTRPDIEARLGDKAVVKIEAKLDAPFDPAQLRSYFADLQRHLASVGPTGVLLALVPSYREQAACDTLRAVFDLIGEPPWTTGGDGAAAIALAVLTWDEVLESLGSCDAPALRSELAQFEGMYRELRSTYVAPLTTREALIDWRIREGDFIKLVDAATRILSRDHAIYPMDVEPPDQAAEAIEPRGYARRYVCHPWTAGKESCFAMGVRDPFAGSDTPIWMRFNKTTGRFSEIRTNLQSSTLSPRLTVSGGHIWIPLEIPLQASSEDMVASLVAQADEIQEIAYADMT